MPTPRAAPSSARRAELLELAYAHVLQNGLAGMSLRPLGESIGSSAGVLLFCFGSKEGLVRALLGRARDDELALLAECASAGEDLATVASRSWMWLAAPEHAGLLRLWVEVFGQSLVDPDGPWGGFAQQTVDDWLALLAGAQPARRRRTGAGRTERTLVLAILRGALLDLLATGDRARATAAVEAGLATVHR